MQKLDMGEVSIFGEASLNSQVAMNIQQMIMDKQIEPGSQLPSERDLAKQFGINRTTVGEAISLLEHSGLVRKMVGRGTFVIDMPRSIVADTIERFYIFGTCSLAEFLRFREIQEPQIAAQAAEYASPEDCDRLSRYVETFEETYLDRNLELNVRADVDFHQALATASGNGLLIAISGGISKVLSRTLTVQRQAWLKARQNSSTQKKGKNCHRDIYKAVLKQDPAAAQQAMARHMQIAHSTMWKHLLKKE